MSNARFINCLVRLGLDERLRVGAVETASFARDFSSAHHRRMRTLIEAAGGRIFTLPNGTGGRDHRGGVRSWRRTGEQAARRLEAEVTNGTFGRILVLSFDIGFLPSVPRLARREGLVHVHVPQSTAALYESANPARRRLEQEAFAHAGSGNTFIGAISEFMRDHLRNVYGIADRNLIDVPTGVIPDLPDPAGSPGQSSSGAELHSARARLDLPRGEPFVLAYGRAARQKGFDLLIDALVRSGLDLRCVLIATDTSGDGAYPGRLKAAWRASGLRGALITEPDSQLPRLLRRCPELIAVVVPSRVEAFGRVPAECFADPACAAPVIAADTGGLAEQVRDGETGFTFEPGNPEALAACLRRAESVASEERRRLMRNAARLAAERYDYLANVREFLAELSRRLAHPVMGG